MVGSQSAEKGTIRQEKQSTILQRCLEFESVSSRRLIVETRSLLTWSLDLQDRIHSGLPSPPTSSRYRRRQGNRLACDDRCRVRTRPASHLDAPGRSPCLCGPEHNLPTPRLVGTSVLFPRPG